LLALPLFAISFSLNFVDFSKIWRYFGWANQTVAAVALWCATVYLARRHRCWWLAFIPAVFMTVVTTTYILVAPEGLQIDSSIGTIVISLRRIGTIVIDLGVGTILGIVIGLGCAVFFLWKRPQLAPEEDKPAVVGKPTDVERAADSLAC